MKEEHMWKKMSNESLLVIVAATNLAIEDNSGRIRKRHLSLALNSPSTTSQVNGEAPPWSPSCKRWLERSLKVALVTQSDEITPDHIRVAM